MCVCKDYNAIMFCIIINCNICCLIKVQPSEALVDYYIKRSSLLKVSSLSESYNYYSHKPFI